MDLDDFVDILQEVGAVNETQAHEIKMRLWQREAEEEASDLAAHEAIFDPYGSHD